MVVFKQKWLCSDKMVVFGQSGCNSLKWLYSGRSVCIRDKSDCIRVKWLYLGKNGCIRATVVVFGKRVVFG